MIRVHFKEAIIVIDTMTELALVLRALGNYTKESELHDAVKPMKEPVSAFTVGFAKPYTFADLKIGQCFRFSCPPLGWSLSNLVKVEQAPGWAMPKGWDFVLATDPEAQTLEVQLLDVQAPQPSGPSIPE